jgi:mannosyl-3-phosphoglycerate phosphatase family protein
MDMHQKLLVYTDLDGTLLDHFSYSFAAAQPMLGILDENNIPVIPVTSKTRAELFNLRNDLNNHHPFIVENGAAVFIPKDYFPEIPSGCYSFNDFYCYQFSNPRSVYQELLNQVSAEFGDEFITFEQAGTQGIVDMTGLDQASAALANERDFSEPLSWTGSETRKQQFIRLLEDQGATILQGGRFLHVTGGCDKGKALKWLTDQFQQQNPDYRYTTLAAGDSHNDVAMLEAADHAVLIRSPVHSAPDITHPNIYKTEAFGPEGWAESLARLSKPFIQSTYSTKPLKAGE